MSVSTVVDTKDAEIATNDAQVALTVNGRVRHLDLDPRTSLLDALREHLHLTGTKKGCDHGQCGACTVLINGRRIVNRDLAEYLVPVHADIPELDAILLDGFATKPTSLAPRASVS